MNIRAAEFRLTQPETEEEVVFVRAQTIIEMHASGEIKTLSPEQRRVLLQCADRAKRAQRRGDFQVELSPYMVAALGLE